MHQQEAIVKHSRKEQNSSRRSLRWQCRRKKSRKSHQQTSSSNYLIRSWRSTPTPSHS